MKKDDERFRAFGGRHLRITGAGCSYWRSNIPRPAVFGEAAHPTVEGDEAIPEEDTTLDVMRKAVEDIAAFKNLSIFPSQHVLLKSGSKRLLKRPLWGSVARELTHTRVGDEPCQDQDETNHEDRNISGIIEDVHSPYELIWR